MQTQPPGVMSKLSHFAVTPERIAVSVDSSTAGLSSGIMGIIGRYIFRQTGTALAMILITLTLIVWMTTALREISLVTSQGQSVMVFLTITSLTMPNLIAVVAPIALLIASLHTLNRLAGDSELIVISAAGGTIWRVAKPYLLLAFILFGCLLVVNAYVVPQSMRTLRDYAIKVRTDLISQVLQPGKFSTPERGLTLHIAARADNGDLLGLVIHDERDPTQIMTYLAERSVIQKQSDDRALLIMHDGHVQRQDGKTKEVNIVSFESYIFDLSQFGPKEGPRDFKPRERFLSELISPDPNDVFYQRNAGRFQAELHDRLSSPLYPFMFVLIAVVHLGAPRTTRESRMRDLSTAFVLAMVLRVIGLSATNAAAQTPSAALLVWGIPVGGIVLTALMAHFEIKPMALPSLSLPSWLRRPARQAAAS
jgi:lipopolysaccharide export system permease protein